MPEAVVLYVEDEDSDVLLLRLAFDLAGLKLALKNVSDGEQAMKYLAGSPPFSDRTENPLPKLVLLDLNLPRHSGFEVLQWIRSHECFADLPVIIYTSSLNADDFAKAQRLGANSYTVKLSDVDQIANFARDLA